MNIYIYIYIYTFVFFIYYAPKRTRLIVQYIAQLTPVMANSACTYFYKIP